jgi:hypothetical protein
MSRITIIILIYHRHKPADPIVIFHMQQTINQLPSSTWFSRIIFAVVFTFHSCGRKVTWVQSLTSPRSMSHEATGTS